MSYRLLVPLDGSTLAEGALPFAADLVRRTKGALRVARVHVPVVPIATVGDLAAPYYDPAWDEQLRAIATTYTDEIATRERRALGASFSAVVVDGPDVAHELETAADAFNANMIVMTTHGRGGWARAWLGSVADSFVRSTRRLVLVLPERAVQTPPAIRQVMIALNGSSVGASIVEPAAEFASAFGAQIALVRVIAPPLIGDMLTALSSEGLDRFGVDRVAEAAKADLDTTAARLRDRKFTVTSTVLVHANPARALLEHIEQSSPDLIAMATHGRGLSRVFVGSVADKVLRGSGRPVLLRRPEG